MNLHHLFYHSTQVNDRPENIIPTIEGDKCIMSVERSDVNTGLRYQDFNASNLINSGSSDLLKNNVKYSVNNLKAASSLESALSNFDDHLTAETNDLSIDN